MAIVGVNWSERGGDGQGCEVVGANWRFVVVCVVVLMDWIWGTMVRVVTLVVACL